MDKILHIILIAIGLNIMYSYIFGKTIEIPGEILKPGTKPYGRLFVFLMGLILTIWSIYSLITGVL